MNARVSEEKTDQQKEKHMAKFCQVKLKPNHPRAVTSEDGLLTVLTATNGVRKPSETKKEEVRLYYKRQEEMCMRVD